MWEQVAFSIGKHSMAMDLLQCQAYPSPLPHPAHGVAAAHVVAPARRLRKIHQSFTGMQNGKNLMLPSSTLGR